MPKKISKRLRVGEGSEYQDSHNARNLVLLMESHTEKTILLTLTKFLINEFESQSELNVRFIYFYMICLCLENFVLCYIYFKCTLGGYPCRYIEAWQYKCFLKVSVTLKSH